MKNIFLNVGSYNSFRYGTSPRVNTYLTSGDPDKTAEEVFEEKVSKYKTLFYLEEHHEDVMKLVGDRKWRYVHEPGTLPEKKVVGISVY